MSESASSAAEEAKNQVNECEKEIASIKARLKTIGPATANEDTDHKNSLTVTLVKVRLESYCFLFILRCCISGNIVPPCPCQQVMFLTLFMI